MSSLIDKETLDDFYDNYIVLTCKDQRLFPKCFQRCKEIISDYKTAFPCTCAQLELLLLMSNQRLMNAGSCLVAMSEVIKHMYEDNISGKLSRDYEQEQKKTNVRKFISVVKRVKIREIEIVYDFIGTFDFEGARERSQTAQDKNNAKAGAA